MIKHIILIELLFLSILSIGQTKDSLFIRALNKEKKQDYQGAITDFTKAIGINPNHSENYYNRAVCKAKLADY